MAAHTLGKRERLCGRRLTEQLFSGSGSHSMAVFPLRMVWMETERQDGEPPVQMLVSVSKRRFKHAVRRNRVKRQVREAYRHTKELLAAPLAATPQRAVVLAFIWLSDRLEPTAQVSDHVRKLMQRLSEKL